MNYICHCREIPHQTGVYPLLISSCASFMIQKKISVYLRGIGLGGSIKGSTRRGVQSKKGSQKKGSEKDNRKTTNWKKLLRYAINLATLAGLAIAGARYLSGEEFIQALRQFDLVYLPIILALSALYLFSKAYRFLLMMRPVSSLPGTTFLRGYVAGASASLVPGGVSIRAGLMNQAGVPFSHSAGPVAFSSLLDQVVFLAGALLAALVYPPIRPIAYMILATGLALAIVLIIPPLKYLVSLAVERVARWFKIHDHWANFRMAMKDIITWRIMAASFAISIASLMVIVYAFHFSLLGFGLPVSYPVLLLAYIVPTFLGRIAGTPGGVGVTEAGMVGFLTSIAAVDPEPALAAAAVFRAATVVFQALLGVVVYFFFWKGEEERQAASDKGREHAS
jgi:uncharacterized protein (TIRG00374 family)